MTLMDEWMNHDNLSICHGCILACTTKPWAGYYQDVAENISVQQMYRCYIGVIAMEHHIWNTDSATVAVGKFSQQLYAIFSKTIFVILMYTK